MKHPDKKPNGQTSGAVDKPTADADACEAAQDDTPNPPRTTTGRWLTTPKFGSATSGGGELEPGPERD